MVGMAQQGVGIGLVDRVDGGADARGDDERPRADTQRIRLRDIAHHPLDGMPALFERRGAQQQHELVAAQARHRIVAACPMAQRAAQPLGQLGQQPVAGLVAEAVVDRLEMVEVEIADRQQETFALARLHRLAQHARKPRAVGQAGELVGVGLALELFALGLGLRDVGERQRIEADLARLRLHRRDRHLQRARFAGRLSRITACWRSAAEPSGAGRISAGTVPSISSRE